MKKVLIAFNETEFSHGAFDFVRRLHDQSPLMVTGLFLPQLSQASLWSYTSAINGVPFMPVIEDPTERMQKNIDLFIHKCEMNGITYRVHKDYYDFALPELEKETRFADLLIFSSEKLFSSFGRDGIDASIADALHMVECPVVVVPEVFEFPVKNILAYDGSESSVYAIKMFSYLFPEMCDNETLLIYSNEQADPKLPSEVYIEELATQHFKNLELSKVSIYPSVYFAEWLNHNKNAILISGAYGRSGLSQLFKKSFIKNILAKHHIPLFIAHR